MKTWEMMKILSENPQAKFKCENESRVVKIIDGVLKWEDGQNQVVFNIYGRSLGNNLTGAGTLDKYEWEKILQPVTFQEAFNSRINGKTIKSVWDDIEYVYDGDSETLIDDNEEAMSVDEINEADWYIID